MTNPDNAGGLPTYSDDDLHVILQDWDDSDPGSDQCVAINLARELLQLRELCRAAPAGGDDVYGWVLTGPTGPNGSMFCPATHRHVMETHLKLHGGYAVAVFARPQDSAPAGGDVERDADFYSAGYSNGYKHATKDSARAGGGLTLENAPLGTLAPATNGGWWCRVTNGWKWNGPDGNGGVFPRPGGDWNGTLSAPAGSGEVDEFMEGIPRALELADRLIAAGPKAAHVSASETHEISEFVREAAALLRRLSQGADYVMVPRVPTEAMEVAFCETWFAKRRPIDDPEMADAYAAMIAASQGQEGR